MSDESWYDPRPALKKLLGDSYELNIRYLENILIEIYETDCISEENKKTIEAIIAVRKDS